MNIDFHHALVALDQSEASEIIVNCLGHFIQLGTRKLTLFTSVNIPYPGGLAPEDETRYKGRLDRYREKLEAQGFEVSMVVRLKINAYAPSQIIDAAKEHEAGYIIIANRGHSKYRELLLGSTVTEVLQRCTLPVYLINISVSDEPEFEKRTFSCVRLCRDSLQNILYPTDFSPISQRAFDVLTMITPAATRNVTLLHVQASGRPGVDDPETLKSFDKTDTDRLNTLKASLSEVTGAVVQVKIAYGSPVKQILEHADDDESTMIIMGSQGRGYVSDLVLGGVCLQVIRNASIPVLIVPKDRSTGE
ncbi:MAG: universal stress protein [Rhodothermaceae bacterium]|nr:universal stress protein [Rhodothermaceae bacterium]